MVYEYTKHTLESEESWLGVNLFSLNQEWSWWSLEEISNPFVTDDVEVFKIRIVMNK